jgi:hypothetical protein
MTKNLKCLKKYLKNRRDNYCPDDWILLDSNWIIFEDKKVQWVASIEYFLKLIDEFEHEKQPDGCK